MGSETIELERAMRTILLDQDDLTATCQGIGMENIRRGLYRMRDWNFPAVYTIRLCAKQNPEWFKLLGARSVGGVGGVGGVGRVKFIGPKDEISN
jgi:hypothetical protein